METIISRADAREQGLTQYFTGKPCKYGHIVFRHTVDASCSTCRLSKSRKYYANNSDYHSTARRKSHLKLKFGLTPEQYVGMSESQAHVCATCLQPDPSGILCVDHCHATGKIRGLLCHNCNIALGKVRDNIEVLNRLAQYVASHNLEEPMSLP